MEANKDIFDRIMELPGLRVFNGIYKENKGVLVYLFFGDLTILDRINFMAILNYLKNHTALLLVLQVAAPYGVFLLYYLSYRISCVLFRKRGLEND